MVLARVSSVADLRVVLVACECSGAMASQWGSYLEHRYV